MRPPCSYGGTRPSLPSNRAGPASFAGMAVAVCLTGATPLGNAEKSTAAFPVPTIRARALGYTPEKIRQG